MTERFHYQTPESEKPFDKKREEDLLQMLNLEKARTLARDHSLEHPAENVHSAMDITNILKDGMDQETVIKQIKAGGYEGVNIPTDALKTVEQATELKERLGDTKIKSFHGVLDPYFVGYVEKPNPDLIKHDFEIAKTLDPDEETPINYDLAAGDLKVIDSFEQGKTLAEIHQEQREILEKKGIKSDKDLIDSIVKYVAESRPKDSKRKVVFETRQSIAVESPEITEENLQFFVETCRKYFDDDSQWGLTVDMGHILGSFPREKGVENVQKMRKEAERTMQVLEKYKNYIKMVHVSGTVTAHTMASYTIAERVQVDPEVIKAWSVHQVVDNKFIVEMVKRLREMKGDDEFVEVSEVRPIHSGAKYLRGTVKFDEEKSKTVHLEQIKLQGDILGYSK